MHSLTRFRISLGVAAAVLLAAAGIEARQAVATREPASKAAAILTWTPERREQYIAALDHFFLTRTVKAGGKPHALDQGAAFHAFANGGSRATDFERLMKEQHIDGVLVLQNGRIRLERYQAPDRPTTRWNSFSMSKSMTSTLVGAAMKDGYIKSLDDDVTRYIKELRGSAYEGVTIKQLLTMTSGVKWNEDYTDMKSDIAQMYAQPADPGFDMTTSYVRKLPREATPGTKWVYKTSETNLVGVLVAEATGKKLADYLSEKIWRPYGMERDAEWMIDDVGHEQGGCCLAVTLRDYGRFGQFILDGARINGQSIVPDTWLPEATRKQVSLGGDAGYGYQWWTRDDGTFEARGIYGQTMHIDRARHVVIVLNSAAEKPTDRAGSQAREDFIAAVKAELDSEKQPPAPDQEIPTVNEEVIVSATRSEKRLQDEPLRVEVLDREEIEEKLLMTPGDIAMMLNETAGLRVQVTAPSLGAASLRVQGLRGRYTQLLSDGLPLYGGQSGSIGLLQIPPMDLGRVEVIKGVASSLFGSSALGGVINLVSRQPGATGDHEVLLNQTSQGGTDAMLWLSGPLKPHWGYTLLAGGDHQQKHDVDGDGWADSPGFSRVTVRPRFFWNNGEGRSVFFTAGVMTENRAGGTLTGATVPDGKAFVESIDSRRVDTGVVARLLVGGNRVLGLRGSATAQTHAHLFGDVAEDDRHATGFGEASLTGSSGRHTWVVGAAVQSDEYRADQLPKFDYTYWVPSLFAQDDYAPSSAVGVSLSARVDHHNRFGTFVSPRVSVLLHAPNAWTVRLSGGGGYFAPTPLTDETEAAGLTRLARVTFDRPEKAQTYSADVSRVCGGVELNATVFGSRVSDAIAPREVAGSADTYELVALSGPTRTVGFEGLAKLHRGELSAVATYTYVHATEPDATSGVRLDVPLTPRHAIGLVGMWEREGVGRAGVEFYYTGTQRLQDDPYRTTSVAYPYFGAMAERRVGSRLRVFVNAENLTDRRQTRFDSLVRPSRNFDGRWTVDAWAPLEGRTANAGVRWSF